MTKMVTVKGKRCRYYTLKENYREQLLKDKIIHERARVNDEHDESTESRAFGESDIH